MQESPGPPIGASLSTHPASDAVFAGSVPEIYDDYLVPLIFEHYANDLADRLGHLSEGSVLELACGTGVVTRAVASQLPAEVAIVGSDLNEGMLDRAREIGTSRAVDWRQVDALDIPFPDGEFDAVLCQFGVMFFPDRRAAYAEVRRVLKSDGAFIFNVWDTLANNEFADEVTSAVQSIYPSDPPQFLPRTPHGHHDEAVIRSELADAGFSSISVEVVETMSRAPTPAHPAIAYVMGTPLRDEIVARDATGLDHAVEVATAAVTSRFGSSQVEGLIRGFVVTARL